MKNILVLAYALSPTRGSEFSVGWNYVTEMSKYHYLTVLYGASGEHLGDTKEVETYISQHPIQNVQFIAVKPSKITNCLNSLNKRGFFVYTFYFAYKLWHKTVYKIALELISLKHFDIIHYVNPIGYREPGYLWKLKLPYIWGPIGGTNNVPFMLIPAIPSLSGKIKLISRTILNTLQLHVSLRVKRAIQRCDILLTATTENQIKIRSIFHIDSYWMPENGIINEVQSPNLKKFSSAKIHLIWIGRIDGNKSLIILLKALALIPIDSPIILHVIGDGPLNKKMKRYAEIHKINHFIEWHGKVYRKEVFDILEQSHLHIITSLSEGNPTTLWEAMSYGVPTMSLDHCGMHDVICEKCGIKIPIRSYKQVVNDISKNLLDLINNPIKLKELSDGVIECAKKFKWESRIDTFNQLYDKAIDNYKKKASSCH